MKKKLIKLNLFILLFYFIFWLVLDLMTIYLEVNVFLIRAVFNLLLTLPLVSFMISFNQIRGKESKRMVAILNALLTAFIVSAIGFFVLIMSVSFIHLLIGGSV